MWLNEWEVRDSQVWFIDGEHPNLNRGAEALNRLVDWTNGRSDGWAYWNVPAKSAEALMTAMNDARLNRTGDIGHAKLGALLRPVRAMLRTQGVEKTDEVLFPAPPPAPVSYAPCITGKIEIEGRVSEFMIPLDPESSTMYSQWGADNTVLWPRTDLVEKMAETAREWVLDYPEAEES